MQERLTRAEEKAERLTREEKAERAALQDRIDRNDQVRRNRSTPEFARTVEVVLRALFLTQSLELSVGVTCHPYLLEIEGLFTQGWRPGRTVGESVDGILEMDSSDW